MTPREKKFIIQRMSALGYIEKDYEAAPGIHKKSFAGQVIILKQCWEFFKWGTLFELKIIKIKK